MNTFCCFLVIAAATVGCQFDRGAGVGRVDRNGLFGESSPGAPWPQSTTGKYLPSIDGKVGAHRAALMLTHRCGNIIAGVLGSHRWLTEIDEFLPEPNDRVAAQPSQEARQLYGELSSLYRNDGYQLDVSFGGSSQEIEMLVARLNNGTLDRAAFKKARELPTPLPTDYWHFEQWVRTARTRMLFVKCLGHRCEVEASELVRDCQADGGLRWTLSIGD